MREARNILKYTNEKVAWRKEADKPDSCKAKRKFISLIKFKLDKLRPPAN